MVLAELFFEVGDQLVELLKIGRVIILPHSGELLRLLKQLVLLHRFEQLTRAIDFRFRTALINFDFPTFERPAMANCGLKSRGKSPAWYAAR